MPYLAFNLNNGNEFIFDLVEERLSLGRNPRNEIVIENNYISSFHAELIRQKDGSYEVVDLKSANGIFVNDRRVEKAFLKPGDRVRFGQLDARFRESKETETDKAIKTGVPSAEEKRKAAESSEGRPEDTKLIPLKKEEAPAAAEPAKAVEAQPAKPAAPPVAVPAPAIVLPKPTLPPPPTAPKPTPPPQVVSLTPTAPSTGGPQKPGAPTVGAPSIPPAPRLTSPPLSQKPSAPTVPKPLGKPLVGRLESAPLLALAS